MSAHGQTMVWQIRLGKATPEAGTHWFQRLRQWWTRRSESQQAALQATLYQVWDNRREQLRPGYATSAFEHVAQRDGESWLMTLPNASL
jgi:hypothetical protein